MMFAKKVLVNNMNFKANESEKKLRGSYYTSEWIANFVARWIKNYDVKTILEPSCGDGVFFDEILKELPADQLSLIGFDTDAAALDLCRKRPTTLGVNLSLHDQDFLAWAIENIQSNCSQKFDAVVGNPPFVRYQYLEKDQQANAQKIFELLGMKFTKHTNLWIPFVVSSIEFLNPGGVIGMVIPSEILHVLYAQGLREYLLSSCSKMILIDPEDLWFDDTLQGAMLLMAQKKITANEKTSVAIIRTKGKEFANGTPYELFCAADYIPGDMLTKKWTYALLSKEELAAYKRVRSSKIFTTFDRIADVDVGIVTGANKFFLVPDIVVQQYSLEAKAHPMFGRSEHCPGVIYDQNQHDQNREHGYPTNFLYFDSENDGDVYAEYLEVGAKQDIPSRYKCRIRQPWYKVPSVFSTPVNMLKRSNGMPRLILNRLNAYTTDTAYRITPNAGIDAETLVACFLNSVTALSAELEGRFYGGGVLELVPSEIECLVVPYVEGFGTTVDALNINVRQLDGKTLLELQDKALFSGVTDIDYSDIVILQNALARLQLRRQRIASDD